MALHFWIYQRIVIWRLGRVAEGAPLLRVYGVYSLIEGSNPSVSAIKIKSVLVADFVLKVKWDLNPKERVRQYA